MRIRDAIKALLVRPIAFHPALARMCGSANAGLMLSQAIYWSERTQDTGGWFYKTHAEWTDEICLSRDEQKTARMKLQKLGFWQEERRGITRQLYFRVDMDRLALALATFGGQTPHGEIPQTDGEIPHTDGGFPETDGQKPQTDGQKPRSIKEAETTSETTSETTQKAEHNAAASAAPAVIAILLNDGQEFPITPEQIREWTALYPAVDVLQELRKMRGWASANPRNRKTRSGILRFVNRWLSTAQDEAPVRTPRGSEATVGMTRPPLDSNPQESRNPVAEFLEAHEDAAKQARGAEVWAAVMAHAKATVNPHSFDTWFKPLRFFCMDADGMVYVRVPMPEFRHVGESYSETIQQAIESFEDVTGVQFVWFN